MGAMRNFATYNSLGEMGRLGNCLFQIATTIAYAIDNDKNVFFPSWKYNAYLESALTSGRFISPATDVRENGFSYSKLPRYEGSVNLIGYFQSHKYFDHHREAVLYYLRPGIGIRNHVQKESLLFAQRSERVCAIHVRRGDYASNPLTNAYHGLLPMSYYKDAIAKLYSDTSDVLFVIFTDDEAWCREHFQWLPEAVYPGNTDLVDLYLMSTANDIITANSSFSWWGAYLNKHKDKRIVMPSQWFIGENAPKDTQDIYLPNAIII